MVCSKEKIKQKVEYKILRKLINIKYSNFDTEEDRFNECKYDLKNQIRSDDEIALTDHQKAIDNTITLKPSKAIAKSNKTFKSYLENFFETPDIFSKCRNEAQLNKYFQNFAEEESDSIASASDKIEHDASEQMFYGVGLIKMFPYEISLDNYSKFLLFHDRAKEIARNDPKTAALLMDHAIDLSKGIFIEAHNRKALSIWHGQEFNLNTCKDYLYQRGILIKNNQLGVDKVITDLFEIYQKIIDGDINNKIRLNTKYNDWHFDHRNSPIGNFNIPAFHLMPDLTQLKKDLIQELNRLLLEESRYANIYLGDTIV